MRAMTSIALVVLLAGCGGDNTGSSATSPGEDKSAETALLETGADLLQDKTPLRKLDAYLDGFHFASGDMASQMEAHHYCGHLNEEVIQCVLFDGNAADAKIVGVEYIVSAKLFAGLPREEKHLWHSHAHEVRSGQLVAPGIPEVADRELMEKIAGTYGKTWHTWHTQGDDLPLGIPMLMMGFTKDGQVKEELVRDRDARFGLSSGDKRRERAGIPYPVPDTDADAWQKGISPRLAVENQPAAAR
jgi:hypothetical protein